MTAARLTNVLVAFSFGLSSCVGLAESPQPQAQKWRYLADLLHPFWKNGIMHGGPPFQPAYPEVVRQSLQAHYHAPVELTNLSISGKDTVWALSMVEPIVDTTPDLIILAFGMNDAAGRQVAEYQANTKSVIDKVRVQLPETEFVPVASMIGNRNWTALQSNTSPQLGRTSQNRW